MGKKYTFEKDDVITMKEKYKKVFGELMRAARKKQGLSQRELAEMVGVSTTYCGNIEHGKYAPTWIIWLRICTALDIDFDEMCDTYVMPEVREIGQLMGIKL